MKVHPFFFFAFGISLALNLLFLQEKVEKMVAEYPAYEAKLKARNVELLKKRLIDEANNNFCSWVDKYERDFDSSTLYSSVEFLDNDTLGFESQNGRSSGWSTRSWKEEILNATPSKVEVIVSMIRD